MFTAMRKAAWFASLVVMTQIVPKRAAARHSRW
jgi:hypothetical protein